MGKKEELSNKLKSIVSDSDKLERFLIDNSNLPGPRGNIELAFGFAEIYDDLNVLLKWAEITAEQANVNNPKSFLTFCAAVCLGKIYTKTRDKKIISVLKNLSNDERWRIREGVAFGFQIIGEDDFNELKIIFSDWIKNSNNYEKRAILVSLAHPKFLNENNTQFCFHITDIVLKNMDRETDFDVLKKGLEFTISVFTAANPNSGFRFIKKWIGKDKVIDNIMKNNLRKKRLARMNAVETTNLLNSIQVACNRPK